MNLPFQRRGRRERGSVAVEYALILSICIAIIAALLLFGRVVWHYRVVQEAAHDAARLLATASSQEMKPRDGGSEVPAALVAQSIARQALADLAPGAGIDLMIQCQSVSSRSWRRCNRFDVPKTVMAHIEISIIEPFFGAYTSAFNLGRPSYFKAMMATDYVGN